MRQDQVSRKAGKYSLQEAKIHVFKRCILDTGYPVHGQTACSLDPRSELQALRVSGSLFLFISYFKTQLVLQGHCQLPT